MSSGPDFAIVTRHALTGSRRSALLASFGVTVAILVHVTYCVLGLAVILAESPLLFRFVQIGGALYLAYLGVRLLIESRKKISSSAPETRPGKAFMSGFLTNLLNPKATLFLLSIFTRFLAPGTPVFVEVGYGLTVSLISFAWFGFLSFLITHPRFRPSFNRFQTVLMRGMGIILLILALSVFLSF